ncbi:MAG TPA: transcription termination factor Rho [Phycisphaerae bacterium]|nr:transcription termination factor Rho [Phycisphaerae bacterium]
MSDSSNVVTGTLEYNQNAASYLRDSQRNYAILPSDPQVPRDLIGKFHLRGGETITGVRGNSRKARGQPSIVEITSIGGISPGAYSAVKPFDDLVVVHPVERLKFETPGGPPSTRIVDLLTPIGKGQRGLIVAPPRTGKTVLLRQLAEGITANHPEIFLMMLLIDERPEEVTEMRRLVCRNGSGWQHDAPEVVYSSNDKDAKSHTRIAGLMIEKAKRHLELGEDVLILLDSLTRLGRAFNHIVGSSGRTMTGGLDIRALEHPKQMFGAARKIENAGSLTIIASVLIETGSRMDDFIFQEFKGTGNMELVLSRELADRRIWPAMNLAESGTRKEELLLGPDATEKMARLRRRLLSMPPIGQMQSMLDELAKFPSNEAFLAGMAK